MPRPQNDLDKNMIEKLSIWAKNITLAVVIVSIVEMLLPNNKIKKYIKVVMGIYILWNIISQIVSKDLTFDFNNIINGIDAQTSATTTQSVDRTSMDNRLKEICEEELEKDIQNTVEEKGYIVDSCDVDIEVKMEQGKQDISDIKKVVLNVRKSEKKQTENNQENKETSIENIMVQEVQKIKKVKIGEEKNEQESQNDTENKMSTSDIQNIKKILCDEYGVSEKCLKIN